MNPKSTDIFGRLSWLTKSFKNLCCRLGILEQTVAECCEGGGGGGTNPTSEYIPYNDAGTFADSYLKNVNQPIDKYLRATYGTAVGLDIDFSAEAYVLGDINNPLPNLQGGFIVNSGQVSTKSAGSLFGFSSGATDMVLGDYLAQANDTVLRIDDAASTIKTIYGGNDVGIRLNFATGEHILGNVTSGDYIAFYDVTQDFGIFSNNVMYYHASGTSNNGYLGTTTARLYFDNSSFKIMDDSISTDNGFKITYGPNGVNEIDTVSLGDYDANYGNGTSLIIDDPNSIIKTAYGAGDNGLYLDFLNGVYKFGDYSAVLNNTNIIIETSSNSITTNGTLKVTNAASVANGFTAGDYNDPTRIGNVIYRYATAGLDLSVVPYIANIPGVYSIGIPGNLFFFPSASDWAGHSLVIINNSLGSGIPILSIGGNIYTRGLSTIQTDVPPGEMWVFYSDGTDWYGLGQ